ncbi:MAG: hypothetical protein PSX80_07855 [bacterium]|nr:hypothetical protein [bacterium]
MLSDKEFNEVLGTALAAWSQGNLGGALVKIDELIPASSPEQEAHCLLLKGSIMKDDRRLLIKAREEWLRAIPKSRPGSFIRACIEYEIGGSFEIENLIEQARSYYQLAINTCATGDEFSGQKQLGAYLGINNGSILQSDEAMVRAALKKSWRVLELPGEPDLSNPQRRLLNYVKAFRRRCGG